MDDIIWGTSRQVGTQGGDLGRMAALDAGYDIHSSGVTLDRYCGSGITAVNLAAASVMSGFEDCMIAGGTELMSSYGTNKVEGGGFFIDSGNEHLRALWPQPNQGVAADAIATLEGIPRRALDELAESSQAPGGHRHRRGAVRQEPRPRPRHRGQPAARPARSTPVPARPPTSWPSCRRASGGSPTSS